MQYFRNPTLKKEAKPGDLLSDAFFDREEEIYEIYKSYMYNYTKHPEDRPMFVHINQIFGMGKSTLARNIMNFDDKKCLAAVNKLGNQEVINWLKGMHTIRVDMSFNYDDWIESFNNFSRCLSCLIWVNACEQLFGIDPNYSYQYFKDKGLDIIAVNRKLREMAKGGDLFIVFDEVQALETKKFNKYFPIDNKEDQKLSLSRRYVELIDSSKSWMSINNCVLAVGRSDKLQHVDSSKISLVSPCIKHPVFLKLFSKDVIRQIISTCKFEKEGRLLCSYFGLNSQDEINNFVTWLHEVTLGIPRLLYRTLVCLKEVSNEQKNFDYISAEGRVKEVIVEVEKTIPLDINNKGDLAFFQLVALNLPMNWDGKAVGPSRKSVRNFVEDYQLLFEESVVDGKTRVRIMFPWYWWSILKKNNADMNLLGNFDTTNVEFFDKGLAFEQFVVYRLLLASRIADSGAKLTELFPFLEGTVVSDLHMKGPFEIIRSTIQAKESNLEEWTSDMWKKCCSTETPKIYVPSPKSSTPDILLVFPRNIQQLPPLIVGIQCKNNKESTQISSTKINDEIEKMANVLDNTEIIYFDQQLNRMAQLTSRIQKAAEENKESFFANNVLLNNFIAEVGQCTNSKLTKHTNLGEMANSLELLSKSVEKIEKQLTLTKSKLTTPTTAAATAASNEKILLQEVKRCLHRLQNVIILRSSDALNSSLNGTFIVMTTSSCYSSSLSKCLKNIYPPGAVIAGEESTILVPRSISLLLSTPDQMYEAFGKSNIENLNAI